MAHRLETADVVGNSVWCVCVCGCVFVHHVQSAGFVSLLFSVCAWNKPMKCETDDPFTLVETGNL